MLPIAPDRRWGLSEELEEWNCPRPTPDQLYDALDIEGLRGTPLLWERLTDFQRITLRLVCERFLGHEGLKYGDDVAAPKIELPQHGLGFHAYCSPHNHRAKDVLHELATVLSTNVVTEPYVRPRPRWGGRSGSWGSGSMFSARESFSRNKSSCRADPSQAERLSRPRPSAAKARLRSTATDDEVDTPSETPSGATWLRRAPSASKFKMIVAQAKAEGGHMRRRAAGNMSVVGGTVATAPARGAAASRAAASKLRASVRSCLTKAREGMPTERSPPEQSPPPPSPPPSPPSQPIRRKAGTSVTLPVREHTQPPTPRSGSIFNALRGFRGREVQVPQGLRKLAAHEVQDEEARKRVSYLGEGTKAQSAKLFAGGPPLHVTRNSKQLGSCEHMLLYLHEQTWTSGANTRALVQEVKQAMDLGVHILLVHEMPGVNSNERHAVDFGAFFACKDGATPEALLSAGLYHEIAVGLKGGAWRRASLFQLGKIFAQGVGPREAKPTDLTAKERFAQLRMQTSIVAALAKGSEESSNRDLRGNCQLDTPPPPTPTAKQVREHFGFGLNAAMAAISATAQAAEMGLVGSLAKQKSVSSEEDGSPGGGRLRRRRQSASATSSSSGPATPAHPRRLRSRKQRAASHSAITAVSATTAADDADGFELSDSDEDNALSDSEEDEPDFGSGAVLGAVHSTGALAASAAEGGEMPSGLRSPGSRRAEDDLRRESDAMDPDAVIEMAEARSRAQSWLRREEHEADFRDGVRRSGSEQALTRARVESPMRI